MDDVDDVDVESPSPEELSEQILQLSVEAEGGRRPEGLDGVDVWPSVDVRALEVRGLPVAEQGLSVDPEDLGRQWLSNATEQSNYEGSLADDGGDDLHIVGLEEDLEPIDLDEDDRQDEELRRASPPGDDPPPLPARPARRAR